MNERTLPVTILERYVGELRATAKVAERFFGPESTLTLSRVADELELLIENPKYQWVSTTRAATILDVSEETIRRKCRSNTKDFRFEQREGGHYRIWLADLGLPEAA